MWYDSSQRRLDVHHDIQQVIVPIAMSLNADSQRSPAEESLRAMKHFSQNETNTSLKMSARRWGRIA